MPTAYPTDIDTFPTNLNVPDVALAKTLRDMMDAIVALETEGGGGGAAHQFNSTTAHTFPLTSTNANYTLTAADYAVHFDTGTSGGTKTLTLPSAASVGQGKTYQIRIVAGTETLLLGKTGSDTINGTTSMNLGSSTTRVSGEVPVYVVQTDGVAAWYVISVYRGASFVASHRWGAAASSSPNTLSGSHNFDSQGLSADTTLTSNGPSVNQVDASGGARTITLPTITGATLIGEIIVVEKSDSSANAVTVVPGGSETIEGATAFVLRGLRDRAAFVSAIFQPTTTNMWHVLWTRMGRPLVAKTGAYTLTDFDDIVTGDATGGAFTLTLPTAVGRRGRVFVAKKIDASANAVTLDGAGTETIDGAATLTLSTQWQVARIVSNGANWLTI